MTLDLRARGTKHPIKLQLYILQQMTRDLDMPHIRRMIQGPNVIVLEDTRSVEIMHIARIREVVVHVLDLREEACALGIVVAYG